MTSKPDDLPSDLASALAALQAEREARLQAEAVAASARAELSDNAALIAHLELRIEKLKRELYGQRSERTARLLEQLELELEELVTTASEDELAAQAAAAKTQKVRPFMRKRPVRKPWPDDIERERVVIEAPTACACCGGSRLAKIGEDVTRTLEEIPRRFKLIETVREKFTCRDCEKISQPPAPFHATPRGLIGPRLLATILFDKFGMHIPLNRQSARFKCEGMDLPLSTLADQVGHGTFAVMPLFHLIERHVLAAERLHGDDTTIRILAKGKCTTGRIWTYVRDDRALRRACTAGGGLLRLERPTRHTSPEASGRLCRYPAGRLLQRLRTAVRPAEEGVADYAGVLLCPCAAGLLRAG
jgi:transposase